MREQLRPLLEECLTHRGEARKACTARSLYTARQEAAAFLQHVLDADRRGDAHVQSALDAAGKAVGVARLAEMMQSVLDLTR